MGLSLITRGILQKVITMEIARIYHPLTMNLTSRKPKVNVEKIEIIPLNVKKIAKSLTIDINEQRPTITLRPIKKKIYLKVKCEE